MHTDVNICIFIYACMYSYIYIYIVELLIQPHLPNTSLCTILESELYSHITCKFDVS